MMIIEDIDDGYVRISVPGGKVIDTRTNRKYKTVICKSEHAKYFKAA